MTASLGTTNPQKNTTRSDELFDKWFAEKGVRYFSKNHGNSDGHRDYMRVAFFAGWLYKSLCSYDLPEDYQ
jgi:hypothetical protein